MMRQARVLLIIGTAAVLATSLPWTLSAQATVTQTTLTTAVTAAANSLVVASASGIQPRHLAVIDAEAVEILAVSGTTLRVRRGASGTTSAPHAANAVVYTGPPSHFGAVQPAGPCVPANEVALPRVLLNGDVFDCRGGVWVRRRHAGLPAFQPFLLHGGGGSAMTYTAAGALTIAPGVAFLSGTTLAMTLANPSVADNGLVMVLVAANASAHTITYTAGFGGGGTARDVATFGGAVNDAIAIVAVNGVWWVLWTRNVTLA